MNRIWQILPSMAFKAGLYDGILSIHEARSHGDFGVGQFAALDGELIVADGEFYRARADGSVRLAADTDELCFAQLCFYEPQQKGAIPAGVNEQSFGDFLSQLLPFRNSFCAFRIHATFAHIVPTAPPWLAKPYPRFNEVGSLRKSFPVANISGSIVGIYSPVFTEDIGIPGYHFHFISDDRRSGGHVTSFNVTSGEVDAARVDRFDLSLPQTNIYQDCVLP